MAERNIGDEIIEGLENAIEYARGDEKKGRETTVLVPTVDVKSIRKDRQMTQEEFAMAYGFSVHAVRNWEQGRRRPDRSARILLEVIHRNPDVVEDALQRMQG
jgi:putative transcriptional regulator